MPSLLDNPFAVLGLPSSAGAKEVSARARACNRLELVPALTAPRRRLEFELGFLPGVTADRLSHILDALKAGRDPPAGRLSPLAEANLCAHLIGTSKRPEPLMQRLLALQSRLQPDELSKQIEADRVAAEMPPPRRDHVEAALSNLRRTHADALVSGLSCLETSEASRSLCRLIETASFEQPVQAGFIRQAVHAWERATAAQLSAAAEQARAEEQGLASSASAKPPETKALAAAIALWAMLSAPQRLLDAREGMDHPESLANVRRWRALGIELANERGAACAALPIAEALTSGFNTLPTMAAQLEEDAVACRKLAATEALLAETITSGSSTLPTMAAQLNEDAVASRKPAATEALHVSLLMVRLKEAIERARKAPVRLDAEYDDEGNGGGSIGLAIANALEACLRELASDPAFELLRDFAIELHNQHEMTGAAFALTRLMLRLRWRARLPASKHMIDMLRADEQSLQAEVRARQFWIAEQTGELRRALKLVRLLEAATEGAKRGNWVRARLDIEARLRRRTVRLAKWTAVLACLAGVLIWAQVAPKDNETNTASPGLVNSGTYTAASPSIPDASAVAETEPAPEDHTLTLSELKWCQFESERIEGARDELKKLQLVGGINIEQRSLLISSFNNRAERYNRVCTSYHYFSADLRAVQVALQSVRSQLRQEGAEWILSLAGPLNAPDHRPIATATSPSRSGEKSSTPAAPDSNRTPVHPNLFNQLDTPPTRSAPYYQGRADRIAWNAWARSLTGQFAKGANWWARVSGLKHSETCAEMRWAHGVDFAQRCEHAKGRLLPSDLRRKRDRAYRAGWNSVR